MAFTHVDRPIALGPMPSKNRVVRPAHAANLGAGSIGDELIAFTANPEVNVAPATKRAMIDEIVAAHVVTARRCEECSPDGVEVQCGHVDDVTRLGRQFEREAPIDYFSLSAGNCLVMGKLIGGMHEPVGHEMPTSVPVATSRHISSATQISLVPACAVMEANMVGMDV